MKHLSNHPAPNGLFNGPIVSHMADTYLRYGHYALMSAETTTASDEGNAAATAQMAKSLDRMNLSHVPAVGVWKGHREHGFLVMIGDWQHELDLVRLADEHGQDAVLIAKEGTARIISCGEISDIEETLPAIHFTMPTMGKDHTQILLGNAFRCFYWDQS